ncbi:MAG TPA: hypothetical protein VG797_09630 [Phycisphaerales bacterium]|nr:hypothetical protein [Phycisphaerales bacterium]
MDPDQLNTVAQFGMAGLIGWMWLVERRASSTRDKQLSDAHDRILEQRTQLDALTRLIADNTRAVASLEAGQRALADLITRLASPRDRTALDRPHDETSQRRVGAA